jgi:hypothetical protein
MGEGGGEGAITTSATVVTAGADTMDKPDTAAMAAVAFSGVLIAVASVAATLCEAALLGVTISKMRTSDAATTDTVTADGSTPAAEATAEAIAAL